MLLMILDIKLIFLNQSLKPQIKGKAKIYMQ